MVDAVAAVAEEVMDHLVEVMTAVKAKAKTVQVMKEVAGVTGRETGITTMVAIVPFVDRTTEETGSLEMSKES